MKKIKKTGGWKRMNFKVHFVRESMNGFDFNESAVVEVKARNDDEGMRFIRVNFRPRNFSHFIFIEKIS